MKYLQIFFFAEMIPLSAFSNVIPNSAAYHAITKTSI